MITKHEALKLIGRLAKASVQHCQVVNGIGCRVAAQRELAAAADLFRHLSSEPVAVQEIEAALGW